MERLSEFLGIDVFNEGKKIGKITDFFISPANKKITGFSGVTQGIIRNEFFVSRTGILHIDKNGCVVDGKKVFYKRNYAEEYGDISVFSGSKLKNDAIGEVYVQPEKLEIERLSVKKSFIDDLLYGRKVFSVKDVSISKKGVIKSEEKK